MGTGVAWVYSVVAVAAARHLPAGLPRRRRVGRGLFRGGGGDHRAGAARPGAGAARPRADVGRDPRAARPRAQDRAARSRTTAPTRRSRSTPSRSATGCACGPARRCRSTARWSKAAASLDESMVTGESMPVTKERGAKVIGGTHEHDRRLRHARREGRRATPCSPQIVQMVAEAQRSRAPIQRLADQVSGWFVPGRDRRSRSRPSRPGPSGGRSRGLPSGWSRR